MRSRSSLIPVVGLAAVLALPLFGASLLAMEPLSTLSTYVPPAQRLSSISSHCADCTTLVPDRPTAKPGRHSFHRPSRHSTSNYKTVRSGKHLRLKPPNTHAQHRTKPLALPRRALSRLGLHAQHFAGWQLQVVDGDTIRYGTERIRLRGLNAPELSEPGGIEAKQKLAELLALGDISITPHGQDVYGRMLADVFIDDRNVAEIMTSEGFAKRG